MQSSSIAKEAAFRAENDFRNDPYGPYPWQPGDVSKLEHLFCIETNPFLMQSHFCTRLQIMLSRIEI